MTTTNKEDSTLRKDRPADNRLAGGYVFLTTFANLSDEEAKAEDEAPTAIIAVKEEFLQQFIGVGYDSVDDFLGEYTYDNLIGLEPMAILNGAIAFAHRDGYDGTFQFPCGTMDGNAMLAFADYLSGLLYDKGGAFEKASDYLDTLLGL